MFPPFLYVSDINLIYEGIIFSAFTTLKAKAPKLFQVFEELLMLQCTVGNSALFTGLGLVICIPWNSSLCSV